VVYSAGNSASARKLTFREQDSNKRWHSVKRKTAKRDLLAHRGNILLLNCTTIKHLALAVRRRKWRTSNHSDNHMARTRTVWPLLCQFAWLCTLPHWWLWFHQCQETATWHCVELTSWCSFPQSFILGNRCWYYTALLWHSGDVLQSRPPNITFLFFAVCDGSDLVLCTVDCGLLATSVFLHVFDSALQLISSGRCTIIFVIAYGPLSCYAMGL